MSHVRIDTKGISGFYEYIDAAEKQIPFAAALALTRSAQMAKEAIETEMAAVFDRPTRWTMRSLRLFPATKSNLVASVDMKNEADKSTPATKWLGPQIYSGERKDKASELNLRSRQLLPYGQQTAFGKNAKLDKHGNLPRGQITKALSGIGGFSEAGYNANATDSSRSSAKGNARQYFIIRKGKKALGVARRTSKKSMHILIAFVSKPTYSKRLDFYGIGQLTADRVLPDEMRKALLEAVRTAR